jgi:hypothetical protein
MTNSRRKKQMRDRRAKTGESYQAQLHRMRAGQERRPAPPVAQPLSSRGNAHLVSPLQRQAFDALHEYAREGVVFLLDGPVGPDAPRAAVGSGVLFRAGRQVVVLTAAHVLDNVPAGGMSIGGRTPDGVSDAIVQVWRHPSVDVALALLSDDAARLFGQLALSPDVVAAATDTAFARENAMVLCGYPAAYRETRVDHNRRSARVEFACVSYLTTVDLRLDAQQRYRAAWNEGVLTEHDPVVPEVKPGEVFQIAHPGGISGGPLWRFRNVDKGALWAPAKMGAIVGIACSYLRDEGVEFCPSVASWGDWFRTTIAAIVASAAVRPQVISSWLPDSPGLPPRPRVFNPTLHNSSSDGLPPLPLAGRFDDLGELRHDGDLVTQQVLGGPWTITYHRGAGPAAIGFSVGGAGPPDVPDWVFTSARRYATVQRELILRMLDAARHGPFRADKGGVSATLTIASGEVGAWFTRWDEDSPVIMRSTSGLHCDADRAAALAAFLEVPAEARQRLFKIAHRGGYA